MLFGSKIVIALSTMMCAAVVDSASVRGATTTDSKHRELPLSGLLATQEADTDTSGPLESTVDATLEATESVTVNDIDDISALAEQDAGADAGVLGSTTATTLESQESVTVNGLDDISATVDTEQIGDLDVAGIPVGETVSICLRVDIDDYRIKIVTSTEAAALIAGNQAVLGLTSGTCDKEHFDDKINEKPKSGVKGDPHFMTHGGEMFDFHGGCDLVLLDNPSYMGGLGMTIHIRTKIDTWWSYVESAAIRIGTNVLEIEGDNVNEWMYLNGQVVPTKGEGEWSTTEFSSHILRYGHKNGKNEAKVYIGNGEYIAIKTYERFVRVQMSTAGSDKFIGSSGILGRFPDGKRVARDGQTVIGDANTYGQEWQVLPEEPKLFHTYGEEWVVPAYRKCAMPIETKEEQSRRKRRLASGISMSDAENACANETGDEFTACVSDVIATQDLSLASVW